MSENQPNDNLGSAPKINQVIVLTIIGLAALMEVWFALAKYAGLPIVPSFLHHSTG